MKVSVFGIGYVGAVTSACLVDSGHEVIAVDPVEVKVRCINEGRSPIVEKGLDELIAGGVASGRLRATTDIAEAVKGSEISLICVGTPSREDGSLDLKYIEQICEQMGEALRDKSEYHVVVNRSTVVPGTLRDVIRPLLERHSGKRAGEDFGLGNNPEFLRESTAVEDYRRPTMIVVGAEDDRTADNIMSIYEGIDAPRIVTDTLTAEGVKYVSNALRAAKIAFANEVGFILSRLGVDSHKVMNIIFEDPKINLGKPFLMPGYAFGGSCLPKDVRALRAAANDRGHATPFFDSVLTSNQLQIERAFRMIERTGKKNLGFLGISFKAGTDDLRESPQLILAEMLIDRGYNLAIYDPCVFRASRMNGSNRDYLDRVVPHIRDCLVETPADLVGRAEAYIIGNGTPEFADIVSKTDEETPIIDLVRLNAPYEVRKAYAGICW